MTLRARLAGAFFAVLLGPLLVGGWLLAALVTGTPDNPERQAAAASEAAANSEAAAPEPATTQAATALRHTIAADCASLQATADGLAVTGGVRGESLVISPAGAPEPWAICGAESPPAGANVRGLAARAEIHTAAGELTGYAFAVQVLDAPYLSKLAASAGRPVVVAVSPGQVAGQPLPLALGAARPDGLGTGPVVAILVLTALLVAAALAYWLAGLAVRPLGELAQAVRRAAAGDLDARSRFSGADETGRLGAGLDGLLTNLQETQRLSVTDALTGLGNLRHLRESLRREVERASRFGRTLGVLALDLDHFKVVNDRYGHRCGDDVLVEFARRIRGVIREVDLAFRQGGEEFVILLPETDVTGSLTAARRLNEAVRQRPFTIAGGRMSSTTGPDPDQISITVSIGVAVFPRHAGSGTEVLDAADDALYRAKELGRDTYAMAGGRMPEQRPSSTLDASDVTPPGRDPAPSPAPMNDGTPSTRMRTGG